MLNVIGLGNFLKGDDAIGPVVIEKLSRLFDKSQLNLVDAGADAISVLDYLLGKDPVLIIDCAKMGKVAGDVVEFDVNEANINLAYNTFSLHGFRFGDIYKMAKTIGQVASCKIIGVEPKHLNFNESLSSEVEASIPKIINIVKMEAKNDAQKSFDN